MESGVETKAEDMSLTFVEMFEASEQASDTARQNSERCRDYFDSKQWTPEEVAELRKRGQPVLTDNVIAGKVLWHVGQEMSRRTDPKAFPRTPQHEQGAEAATDSIRFVCDAQDWDEHRSAVWENMLIEGYGGVEVIHQEKRGKTEIVINHYPWDRLFYDPHSRKHDFSDARYLGSVIWADKEKAARDYPKAKDALTGVVNEYGTFGETYEDRPRHELWGDRERNRIRIVLMHYLEGGKWKWVKFTKGAILDEGESQYVDEDGDAVCPLLMQSAYVDRENRRYGEVLKMLDQQDEINKRRSKLLHLLNSRQTMGEKGAVSSIALMKRELAKPDGHIEYEPGADGKPGFNIIPTMDMTQGQFALLQEAKQSLQEMSATEALMGAADGDSGRAVLAKQQGAMMAVAPLQDRLSAFTRRVYVAIWQRIRQFWNEEKWIRVTDNERNVRFVGLNRPVTLQEQLQQLPEEQVRAYAMQMQLTPGDPRLQQTVGVENQVESLEVDIILEEVEDTVTLEAETFEQLVNIDAARGGVLPLEMLIEASPLRSDKKEKILKWMEAQNEQGGQISQLQEQMQQVMMKLEAAQKQAETQKTVAETEHTQAETFKTVREAQFIGFS